VTIIPHFSYDKPCKDLLKGEAPFELMFIDGAHDYESAAHDIALGAELLCTNGIMVLHDVGAISGSLDPTSQGGVRQALVDFCDTNPEYRVIFLEFPVWLNNTGTALLSKQQLDPPVERRRKPDASRELASDGLP
jgi:predicted O-methyltransferase YrrM